MSETHQQVTTDETDPSTGSDDDSDQSTSPLGFVEKIAEFVRPHMAKAIGVFTAVGGLLACVGSFYIAFKLLSSDGLDFGDVVFACVGVVGAGFLFAVLMCIHGVAVFMKARRAAREDEQSTSTSILRGIAGALRGYGESFVVAVLVGTPFFFFQALINDDDGGSSIGGMPAQMGGTGTELDMIPLFNLGGNLTSVALSPIIMSIFLLVFLYTVAETLETLVRIRQNTG